jgi:hypothetical protein
MPVADIPVILANIISEISAADVCRPIFQSIAMRGVVKSVNELKLANVVWWIV